MVHNHSPAKGIALIVASCVTFSVMAGLVRYVSNIDAYKTTLVRFAVGLALLGTAALFGRIRLQFVHGPFLFLRGLLGGAAVFIFFFSIPKLGVGKGTVISYMHPIFASILGAVFLKERTGVVKLLAILAAFGGILLLGSEQGAAFAGLAGLGRYELMAVFGALVAGGAVVLIKQLHQTDSTYAILFAQCAVGLWIVLLPANVGSFAIGYPEALILLCIGLLATVGQVLMTEGYRYVSVTTGAMLGMLVPVLNLLAGVVIFHESFSARASLGAGVVVAACVVVSAATRANGSGVPAAEAGPVSQQEVLTRSQDRRPHHAG